MAGNGRRVHVGRAAAVAWHLLVGVTRMAFRLTVHALARRESRASVVGRTLAELFQELGPTYVKLGQILSTRRDLFGEEVTGHLERLRDRLPPGPFSVVPTLFREELGIEIDDAFAELEPLPVASASIATVYRGTLRDGTRVAVKVKRPGIARTMEADLRLVKCFGALLGGLPPLRAVPVAAALEDFCACLRGQLDFEAEAAANRRLHRALAAEGGVVVPALVERLCSRSLVTMEFIDGSPDPRDVTADQARKALRAAVRALYRMIFVEGFVHCDLHPGNIRFLAEGRMAFLDFGFMAELDDEVRLSFARFFYAMASNDGPHCAQITLEMAAYVPSDLDTAAFETEISAIVSQVSRAEAGQFLVADFVGRLFDVQRRYRVRGTTAFVMAILSLLVVEGMVRDIDPGLDFQREAHPYILRASLRPFRPERRHSRPASSFLSPAPDAVRAAI